MKIIVTRGAGDNPSPDVIVDPLCTDETLGTLRGKTYLYDVGFDRLVITLEIKIPRDFLCGDILEYFDPDFGTVLRGKIMSWQNDCVVSDEGHVSFTQTIIIDNYIVVD